MTPDTYTEVSEQGWFSRLGGAFKGIFFGFILVLVAVFLLFWNEGRAVERHKTLKEGAGSVVSVSAEAVDSSHEGDLVHVTGRAESGETLTDPTFGVSAEVLRLEREVEMYQWDEDEETDKEKKVGGGTRTTTTYSYEKTWSERAIDSSGFHQPGGHENPGALPWQSRQVTADTVTVGDYRLSPGLVAKIDEWEALPLASLEALPDDLADRARLHDGGLYLGEGDPGSPEIGDVRVRFRVVRPTDVSVVAQQTGSTFQPFQAKAGGTIELLETGTVSAEEMFEAAQRSNTLLTWGLRLAGLLLMTFGFRTILRPLSVLADVLPPVGSLVSVGTGLVSFALATFISLITVAVAWVFYRPLVGITLVVLAVAAVTWLIVRARKAEPAAAPASSGGSPPPPPPASGGSSSPPPPPPPGSSGG